jgi:alpha-1,2-mannosyltransferase
VLWVVGFASAASLALYLVWLSHQPQMDFQVYRMGADHVFGSGLYSTEITVQGRPLLFTYPPFAAVLFWPLSNVSTSIGQITWAAFNLAALAALIVVSTAAARGRRPTRADWRTSLLLLGPMGLLLYPVRIDLALGQINIVLTLMIVADLTMALRCRGRCLPRGVLVGLAAAIKLTPLVFIAYLVVSRQWRLARNATLAFVAAIGAMFALNPRASWLYFTRDAFDVGRIGNSQLLGNQSLHAAVTRGHVPLSGAGYDLVCAVLLCIGVTVAAVAYHRSSALLAVLICAATGLMLSPISWTHHYVWIVPFLIWLVAGVDRPTRGEWWALGAALTFVVMLPFTSSGSGLLWYVRANAYVVATMLFIAVTAIMLSLRNHTAVNDRALVERVDDDVPAVDHNTARSTTRREWVVDDRWQSEASTGTGTGRDLSG